MNRSALTRIQHYTSLQVHTAGQEDNSSTVCLSLEVSLNTLSQGKIKSSLSLLEEKKTQSKEIEIMEIKQLLLVHL